jgi:hypothetical protein
MCKSTVGEKGNDWGRRKREISSSIIFSKLENQYARSVDVSKLKM